MKRDDQETRDREDRQIRRDAKRAWQAEEDGSYYREEEAREKALKNRPVCLDCRGGGGNCPGCDGSGCRE